MIEAISGGPQGMIEFDPSGRILRANQVLLDIMGYAEAEAVGRKHATFVEPKFAESDEYRRMWERLGNGEALRGTFRRLAKGGRIVYLQGTYSPVRDPAGKVTRVVKVVSDVTGAETERLGAIETRAAMEAERARVVGQLSAGLAGLADGDLTIRIAEAFPSEYETLRANFNGAVETLEAAVAAVVVASGSIRDESLRMTQAADDLSHRTENQAAALEETAASLEQLTASVRAAASGAEKASQDVAATRRSAEESGRIVRQAVDAMSEIEKSSQHISQIIGVIDDIAFQTNLLALNAGVEAARAGEAGRGFAVVASEVRALAQRSSAAAKEIKALISTSSQQVGRGVELVDDTGKALRVIVESVAGITSLIADIANSSREQSVGLSEINTAINQLDQVTQQNAAMVDDSTTASHAMKSEAEALAGLVAQFTAETAQAAGPAQVTRLPARATEARKARARIAAPGA
ncbi:methyl-accepting chemotaxis protein, partial [Amaricoccus sp. W119]|uniref:methyl-accepting chemotaxis protein n=1 Tax=Amaricoccus sp. W119 TaxID=3391833 RepID=UPI0039A5FB6A